MRFSAAIALALFMVADFPVGADVGKIEIGNHVWVRESGKKNGAKKGKERVFRAEFQIEVEQMTGDDTVIGGTTVPGRMFQSTYSTMEIHDGNSLTFSGAPELGVAGDDRPREEGTCGWSIKVESVDSTKVRLAVTVEDTRTYLYPDWSTRSRSFRLQAAKTVKLGEKTKLDLTGGRLPGVKATFVGLIEEKVEQ